MPSPILHHPKQPIPSPPPPPSFTPQADALAAPLQEGAAAAVATAAVDKRQRLLGDLPASVSWYQLLPALKQCAAATAWLTDPPLSQTTPLETYLLGTPFWPLVSRETDGASWDCRGSGWLWSSSGGSSSSSSSSSNHCEMALEGSVCDEDPSTAAGSSAVATPAVLQLMRSALARNIGRILDLIVCVANDSENDSVSQGLPEPCWEFNPVKMERYNNQLCVAKQHPKTWHMDENGYLVLQLGAVK